MYKRPNNLARRRKNWQILTDCCEKKIKENSGDNNGIILTVSRKVAKILIVVVKAITSLKPSDRVSVVLAEHEST